MPPKKVRKLSDDERKRNRREEEVYHEREKDQNRLQHSNRRKVSAYREGEKTRDRDKHLTRRQDPAYREEENLRNRDEHLTRRQDPAYRKEENLRNCDEHRTRRDDPCYQKTEQLKNTNKKTIMRNVLKNDCDKLCCSFKAAIMEEPKYICASCGGLWYCSSVSGTSEEVIIDLHPGKDINHLKTDNKFHLCGTCQQSLKDRNMPRLCMSNGLWFPSIPEQLRDLTQLEERLVALRIPFMQIRSLGADRQYGIRGGVVNVPNDMDVVAKVIPRQFHETKTIQVQLKRKICYKHAYLYQTIRPFKVYLAAKYLVKTDLYIKENVFLSSEWSNNNADTTMDFLVDQTDLKPKDETKLMDELSLEDTEPEEDQHSEEIDAPLTETLIQGDEITAVAPGEGMRPLSLLMDLDAEELSFPSIYCGLKRNLNPIAKLSYTDIARSELRRYDGRCRRADKILYSYRLAQTQRIASNINICLRKKRKRGIVTVRDMLNNDCVENLIQQDDGYRVLSNVVNSPPYLEEKKKDVMAMIRQLGLPSFFITTSAAETKWPELLSMLHHRKYGTHLSEEDATNLSFDTKADLISNDPIGCVMAYDNRERAMDKFLVKPQAGLFSPYKHRDFFKRKEVQQRGSLHTHRMDWLEGAPKFKLEDSDSHESCCKFIDQFVTCNKDESEEMKDVLAYQLHKHSHTCKDKKRGCRFGFPIPPMRTTRILLPLPNEVAYKHQQNFSKIKDHLETLGRHAERKGHDEFLKDLGLTEEEYVFAIRSGLRIPKVFLQRGSNEIYINGYNKKLLLCWRANIDVQFVLDPYACATYVVNYISKSDRGVSKLLREVSKEIRAGNKGLKDRLRSIANSFSNASEVSAQEAACCLLKIPMTQSSRDVTFISTSPPKDRVIYVKDTAELEELDLDSCDIAAKGILDRYVVRPELMDEICLADFVANYNFIKVAGSRRKKTTVPKNALWLTDKTGFITPRVAPRVIRYRRYGLHQEPDEFYREQLMLYVPWRNEDKDLLEIDHQTKYELAIELIHPNRLKYDPSFLESELEDEVARAELDDETFGESTLDQHPIDFISEEQDYALELGDTVSSRFMSIRSPKVMLPEIYRELMKTLNEGQRRYLLDLLHNLKNHEGQVFHLIHGQAGVGKSRLIHAIVQCILRMTDREPGLHGDALPVLVAAATGKAAFNVGGMTLHSAFRLPPNQFPGKMLPLDHGSSNSLRCKFEGLRVLIIDEISLVSLKMFAYIDHRLRQVLGLPDLFSRVSVICVGDFFQLRPVFGKFVFEENREILESLAGNPLWERFRMFELTQIMRQRDDASFAYALNRLSKGMLLSEDIVMFQSREVCRGLTVPDNATYLYYDNAACDAFNRAAIAKSNTPLYHSYSIDRVQGGKSINSQQAMLESAKNLTLQQAGGMPYYVALRIDCQYMVTINISVEDGLVNGATGILKAVAEGTLTNGEKAVKAVFLQFPDGDNVGALARSTNQKYLQNLGYPSDWTPIFSETRVLNSFGHYQGMQIVRRNIPLTPANAITIHKSQSLSIPNTAINIPERGLKREALYVGCSRAPSLAGLYIFGSFRAPRPIDPMHPVVVELARLRHLSFPFTLKYLPDVVADNRIIFHNIQSFRSHIDDIASDSNYMCADILCFCETRTLSSDRVQIPGFAVLGRHDSPTLQSSVGTLLFRNEISRTRVSGVKCTQILANSQQHLQIVTWVQNGVTLFMLYRSPQFPKARLAAVLVQLLRGAQPHPTIFVGDFNCNFLTSDGNQIRDLFTHNGFHLVTPLAVSTDGSTCIDACFSNATGISAWYYESYFSYHKPICITWSDRVCVTNPETDSFDVDNERQVSLGMSMDVDTEEEYEEYAAQHGDLYCPMEVDSSALNLQIPQANTLSSLISPYHHGIPNLGNTCYISSVCQLIRECPAIPEFIQNHRSRLANNLAQIMSAGENPQQFDTVRHARFELAKELPSYPVGQQEDAYLFLIDILEAFEELGLSLEDYRSSILTEAICVCGNKSIRNEISTSMSIAITGTTLQDCVDGHFAGQQESVCEKCQYSGTTNLKSVLQLPPKILILQAKIFQNNGEKILVDIPAEDILLFPSPEETRSAYQSELIICHIGKTLKEGHYVACHRNQNDMDWTVYDDDKVYISQNLVGEGYIHLYKSM